MTGFAVYLSLAAVLVSTCVSAAQTATPYAGWEQREIKALSARQIDDLKAGRGMELALAAELNGFPGPLHVLELADQLELTQAQRATVEQLFSVMKTEAVSIGERLIGEEADLDRQFASRTVTSTSLATSTEAIGRTQAALRQAHLKYHLATRDVLTQDQLRRYGELRGYAAPGGHQRRH